MSDSRIFATLGEKTMAQCANRQRGAHDRFATHMICRDAVCSVAFGTRGHQQLRPVQELANPLQDRLLGERLAQEVLVW
jgi:hypothetical protein